MHTCRITSAHITNPPLQQNEGTISSDHLILRYAHMSLRTRSHAICMNTCMHVMKNLKLLLGLVIVTASLRLHGHFAWEVDFSSRKPLLTPKKHLDEARHIHTHKQNDLMPYTSISKQNTNASSHFAIF